MSAPNEQSPLHKVDGPTANVFSGYAHQAMNTRRIDTWVWVLIYLGMILLALGLAMQREGASLGWGIAVLGMALVAVGVVLIWVRSRMKKRA